MFWILQCIYLGCCSISSVLLPFIEASLHLYCYSFCIFLSNILKILYYHFSQEGNFCFAFFLFDQHAFFLPCLSM